MGHRKSEPDWRSTRDGRATQRKTIQETSPSLARTVLVGKAADAKSDGQSDQKRMPNRAGNVSSDVILRMTDCRQRNNHEVHEQEYQFAVEETAQDSAFDQQAKFSAGQVINGRGCERDREVTDKANGRRGPSHIARMRSKDTSSDTLQDAKGSGSHQAESDKRLSKIQYAGQ